VRATVLVLLRLSDLDVSAADTPTGARVRLDLCRCGRATPAHTSLVLVARRPNSL